MQTNLKATRVLMIDASLILVIAIVLVLSNLFFLDRVNDRLTRIDATRVRKLDLIEQMKRVVRDRSIVMLSMSTEQDLWKIEARNRHFHALATEFIAARDKLVQIGLSDTERSALQSSLDIIKTTEQLQNDIVERIRDGNMKGVESDIVRKDFPLEFRLLGKMEVLYEQVIDTASRQRSEANLGYRRIMILMSAVSFVFILAIILLIRRSLTKIRKIESGLIEKTENLGWDATHDPLTNVFNRRWLKYKIDILLESFYDNHMMHSLLYLDLDGFKQINDSYGHPAGDQYLVRLCREIEHAIRQNDTFCRMGGDEFAILLENCGKDAAVGIAEELIRRVRRFVMRHEGHELSTSCSIGICHFGSDGVRFDDLIRHADELCYEAKRRGRNRLVTGAYGEDVTPHRDEDSASAAAQ